MTWIRTNIILTLRKSLVNPGPKINLSKRGLINSVHDLFERGPEKRGPVEPKPIGEGQVRPTAGTAVGRNQGYELGSVGVDLVNRLGPEEREKLVQGAALGPRRDQAQQRLDWQRREHQVRVFAFFALQ